VRIVSGIHRGRKINPPNNLDVRPTTDRAKEALFSILDSRYYFHEKNVLDLFSGSGNIGFEFSSRGCGKITAVDNNSKCIQFIEETKKELNLNINTVQSDCLKYLKNLNQQFNFIFADPPYDYEEYQELKNLVYENNLVKKDGVLIIEHNKETSFAEDNIELRKYGTVHFSVLSF
jgi:16S rRNA (guanine(966)-N(2))-methyltransferase RsmD